MIYGLAGSRPNLVDSPYAWLRLGGGAAARHRSAVSACGRSWSCCRRCRRSSARRAPMPPLPYTCAMVGFGFGNIVIWARRRSHRYRRPDRDRRAALGTRLCRLAAGARRLWLFALPSDLIGFGAATGFAPLIADISHWFTKRRGIAVAIAATGNYLAGAIWPPVMQHLIVGRWLARDPYRHRHCRRRR